ncbi:MAG: hypothetical protein MJE12_23890 [Alphaproteobacteria bacterium]|nr:hypothetical protein [Alphaproteobacteria bacterium]
MNACKPHRRSEISAAALRTVMIVLGIVLALTPLAFWVAWSEQGWLFVLAIGAAAFIGLLICHWLTEDDRPATPAKSDRAAISEEFLAELSRMGPWTYHNRLTGHARFKNKMARLRTLLGMDEPK